MDLNVRHEYAASPDAVHAMLTSPEYFSDLGRRVGATVLLENQGDVSSLMVRAKSPEQVKAMVGETISLNTRVLWERDGEGWKGVAEAAKLKVPAQISARATVQPGGVGTIVEYFLAVSVTIPFIGKKVEQVAEPRIRAALDAQKNSGDAWLAEHDD